MGFMFFPDMQLVSDEMYRVLKSGGAWPLRYGVPVIKIPGNQYYGHHQ